MSAHAAHQPLDAAALEQLVSAATQQAASAIEDAPLWDGSTRRPVAGRS